MGKKSDQQKMVLSHIALVVGMILVFGAGFFAGDQFKSEQVQTVADVQWYKYFMQEKKALQECRQYFIDENY